MGEAETFVISRREMMVGAACSAAAAIVPAAPADGVALTSIAHPENLIDQLITYDDINPSTTTRAMLQYIETIEGAVIKITAIPDELFYKEGR